jgi:hypothetical protein
VGVSIELAREGELNPSRWPVTVGDIVRANPKVVAQYTRKRRRVLEAIRDCRTSYLGGYRVACDACGEETIVYGSCGDRHCPRCLQQRSREWVDAQRQSLLPIGYFHVIFTVLGEIGELALGNKKVIYGILFAAVADTLKTIGADPQHLGAMLGFLSVLHSWSQTLMHHLHLHVIVPAGGFSLDGTKWIGTKKRNFLLPIGVLRSYFRGAFLKRLQAAYDEGKLQFKGATSIYAEREGFRVLMRSMWKKRWVVYATAPFGSPDNVIKYLAGYTHKVAISNARLRRFEDNRVTFRYRLSDGSNRIDEMTLDGPEFLRRFTTSANRSSNDRALIFGSFCCSSHAAAIATSRIA